MSEYKDKLELMETSVSVHLWCYKRVSNRRPPSRNYQGATHDTEVRWYRYEQNLINRLRNLGFSMNEIEQAYL